MAIMEGTSATGGDYELHPEGGRHRGYIREVVYFEDKISNFKDKDGTERAVPTRPRMIVVENCDGIKYSKAGDDGVDHSYNHSCTWWFAVYDGRVGPGTKVGKMFRAILGHDPVTSPFDDEQILGQYVTYMCEHSEDGQYANATSIRADHDQTPADPAIAVIRTFTQAERVAVDNGASQPPATATEAPVSPSEATTAPVAPVTYDESRAPLEGTVAYREQVREGCRKWMDYNVANQVWTTAQSAKFAEFLGQENDTARLKEFAAKAESDCKGAFIGLPTPHPMSTGGDGIPF